MQAQQSEPIVRWWLGYGPLLFLPAAVFLLTPATWPRWAFMWLLAFSIYVGCKWLTWRSALVNDVPLWRQAGYLLLWPGMDAAAFLLLPSPAARPRATEWLSALGKTLLGVWSSSACALATVRICLPHRLGWHDRHNPHAPFRIFPPGKLCLACSQCGCPTADELAASVGQPRRVLGRALEHRVSGSHLSIPLSPAGATLWAAWSNLCGVPRQRFGPRSRDLHPRRRRLWRPDRFLSRASRGNRHGAIPLRAGHWLAKWCTRVGLHDVRVDSACLRAVSSTVRAENRRTVHAGRRRALRDDRQCGNFLANSFSSAGSPNCAC